MEGNICHSVYPNTNTFAASNFKSLPLVVTNIFVSLLNFFTNSFLIYAIIKTRQTEKISYQFILCLSVSDCCVGIILQPMTIILQTYFTEVQSCALELTAQFLSYIFPQISGVMIMIIAFDRFIHMKFLNKYSAYVTKKNAGTLVALNMVLAFFIGSCSLVASLNKNFFIFNAVLVSIDATVAVATYVFYAFTYNTVRQHANQMRQQQRERKVSSPGVTKKTPKHDLQLAKTVVVILTALSISYLPYFIFGLLWSYYQYYSKAGASQTLGIMVWWSFILVYFNSSLNAIILLARNKKILQLLRKGLCWRNANGFEQSLTPEIMETRSTSEV